MYHQRESVSLMKSSLRYCCAIEKAFGGDGRQARCEDGQTASLDIMVEVGVGGGACMVVLQCPSGEYLKECIMGELNGWEFSMKAIGNGLRLVIYELCSIYTKQCILKDPI